MYHKIMKSLVNLKFNDLAKIRNDLLKNNTNDHVYFQTNSSILISAPHGVSQVRLGKLKVAEIGTVPVAIMVAKHTNANLIVKTKNNDDDANFVDNCEYRERIKTAITTQNIKYLIDFHGLAKRRPCDINLGINFGQNIKQNEKLFNSLKNALEKSGFSVSVDEPFCAGPKTIAGSIAKQFNIWSIQIEMNCAITNEPKNIERCNLLINTIINWLERNY